MKKLITTEKQQDILREANDMARAHERVLAHGLAGILRDCDRNSKVIREVFENWERANKKAEELSVSYWESFTRGGRVRRRRQVAKRKVVKK